MNQQSKILMFTAALLLLGLPAIAATAPAANFTGIAARIYAAAYNVLKEKFGAKQAAILAALMVAQSKYETFFGGKVYNSNAAIKDNNAFGYKYTPLSSLQIGPGITSSEGNKYGKYKKIEDSAVEVAYWLRRRFDDFDNIVTPDQYAAALKKNSYFGITAAQYAAGLKKFM